MRPGLAEGRAKRTVHVNPARVYEAMKGAKCSRETRLAILALARDASLTYREAASEYGATSTAVYRASRLIPEIREVRRHRQRGAR